MRARCGCTTSSLEYYDDPYHYRYEIIFCPKCKATWAYDYDSRFGNVEPGFKSAAVLCEHCARLFPVVIDGTPLTVPYHNYPEPTRQLCSGSKKFAQYTFGGS